MCLTPRSNWRQRYADWPALKKLQYVDELMAGIADTQPALTRRTEVDPIHRLSQTLREHYQNKLNHYAVDTDTRYDRDLQRIFSNEPRHSSSVAASAFIRSNRAQIREAASRWSGGYQVALDAILDQMIDRCRALKLRAPGSKPALRKALVKLLSTKVAYSLYRSPRRPWFAV